MDDRRRRSDTAASINCRNDLQCSGNQRGPARPSGSRYRHWAAAILIWGDSLFFCAAPSSAKFPLTDEEGGASQCFVRGDDSPGPIGVGSEVYFWCIGHALAQKEHHGRRPGRRHAEPARRDSSLRVPKHRSRMNQEWQLRWVRVPEGTHLSTRKLRKALRATSCVKTAPIGT